MRALAKGPCASTDVPGFTTEAEVLVAADALIRQGWIAVTETSIQNAKLTAEGAKAAAEGVPERLVVDAVLAAGGRVALSDLSKSSVGAHANVAVGQLRKKKWAELEKTPAGPVLVAAKRPEPDTQEKALAALAKGSTPPAPVLAELASRALVAITTHTARKLSLTPEGAKHVPTHVEERIEINAITPELLAQWREWSPQERAKRHLRRFDVGIPAALPDGGKPHPLSSIIAEIRDVFVAMGFQQIAGNFVESAFWNMDALFIPQDHPARDMQDTFYLSTPASQAVGQDMFERIRDVQLHGGQTGSTGWGGSFSKAESERALLRTHTTVTTLRHLAANPQGPQKIFGIGRVFRNEALDATHLPEFHQVEGILLEDGADFRMLLGVLREFYARMGFADVKFRPSYYPYTEPSLDVAVKWNDRYLELGGAGIFRPEVTRPLGVEGNVLAWGLGLERLAMMRLGLKDIRQLYLSDVDWLRTHPLH